MIHKLLRYIVIVSVMVLVVLYVPSSVEAIKRIIAGQLSSTLGSGSLINYCLSLVSQTSSGGSGPLRYISSTNQIWAGICCASGTTTPVRIYNAAGTLVGSITRFPPHDPMDMVLDTVRNTVWVAMFSAQSAEFNAITFASTGRVIGTLINGNGISYDIGADRYYLSSFTHTVGAPVKIYDGVTTTFLSNTLYTPPAGAPPFRSRYNPVTNATYIPYGNTTTGVSAIREPSGGIGSNQLYAIDAGDATTSVAFIGSNLYMASNVGAGVYGFLDNGTRLFRVTASGGAQYAIDTVPSINAVIVPAQTGGSGNGLRIYDGTGGVQLGGICNNGASVNVYNDGYWAVTYNPTNNRIYATNFTDSSIDIFNIIVN